MKDPGFINSIVVGRLRLAFSVISQPLHLPRVKTFLKTEGSFAGLAVHSR